MYLCTGSRISWPDCISNLSSLHSIVTAGRYLIVIPLEAYGETKEVVLQTVLSIPAVGQTPKIVCDRVLFATIQHRGRSLSSALLPFFGKLESRVPLPLRINRRHPRVLHGHGEDK